MRTGLRRSHWLSIQDTCSNICGQARWGLERDTGREEMRNLVPHGPGPDASKTPSPRQCFPREEGGTLTGKPAYSFCFCQGQAQERGRSPKLCLLRLPLSGSCGASLLLGSRALAQGEQMAVAARVNRHKGKQMQSPPSPCTTGNQPLGARFA